MVKKRPFAQDPSTTAAFAALRDLPLVRPQKAPRASRKLKAVVIGGGTGAPLSIRTLLSLGVETSAVVAMADDGGSTGLLREEADVTPPGDIRKCIAAMAADPNDPLTRAFKYRFPIARDHSLGNLMLVALEDACGSFPEAVSICEKLLDAQGHVYPSTLSHVTLAARTRDGALIEGQALACHSKTALERVVLRCEDAIEPYAPALSAIRQADLIVLGPGSLFTSIIPNLLVPGVVDAIAASHGKTLFVCGLADVQGETWGLTAREHVEALLNHGMRGLLDYVLVHASEPLQPEGLARAVRDAAGANAAPAGSPDARPADAASVKPVSISYVDAMAIQSQGPVVIARDLIDFNHPSMHDPVALREALWGVLKLCRSHRK